VHLEWIRVDDQPVAIYNAGSPLRTLAATNCLNLRNPERPLKLGPAHRKVEISFAALSFTSPENVQFRHRLNGFDDGWVEVGPAHRATYPRLPAGTYEFQVLACNNSGVWNETGAKVVFDVAPFFWETSWFRVGGGSSTALVAGAVGILISRRRYRRKLQRLEARRALEQERARIAKDIHDDLGSSLTRISLLSQPSRLDAEDLAAAVANLTEIHQTARKLTHSMGEVVWAVNPEHDTFDSLANYLSHFAQNFLRAAGIRCRIEVPLSLPKRPLSAEVRHGLFLAFKEALNNVVKHSGATEVHIALVPGESGFELTVKDNGRGFTEATVAAQTCGEDPARSLPGNGLANMKSRLQEISGECEIHSEPGTGTRITFRVRLRAHHEQP
jgi:signal transduction histidine kinase